MASQDSNAGLKSDYHLIPTLALKQALCFSCWDISSNLNRCSACKRVSYCSVQCQKKDWNGSHKKICKKLVASNKEKGYVPSAGRHWNHYYHEKEQDLLRFGTQNPSELGRLIGCEPHCCHCYRSERQLEHGAKLNACRYCLLTSFCTSCQQTHSSVECATLQDVAADNKILIDLHRRTGKSFTVFLTKFPRKQYRPLSSATDWYDYYTELSGMSGFSSKMNRDLRYQGDFPKEREFVECMRYSTNTTTIQLTLIAALEAITTNIDTRGSINLHLIGTAEAEYVSVPAFEELLHLLPSLRTLQLSFVGPNLQIQKSHTPQCCTMCTRAGRSISITVWGGSYHTYVPTDSYKTPDLAAAFHSGFSVDEVASWGPTIRYLAHAPHPTLFTAPRYFEIQREMEIWKNLGAEFVKNAQVNKWRGMSPSLAVCGDKPNEVTYTNHWWYIVKQK